METLTGCAEAAMPGQTASGDRCIVKSFAEGVVAAVIDGLGHGEEAAEAARAVSGVIEQYPGDSVVSIIKRCNQRLLGMPRGAVITLASLRPKQGTLSCAGVGNVEGVLFHRNPHGPPQREILIPKRGVLGSLLPPIQEAIYSVREGDTLILATDGINRGFETSLHLDQSPQEIADSILTQHGSGKDDALVLVLRVGEQ